ncbi:MAG: NAD(P)H-dependent oxidoreductase [Chlorobi bacterium]|nr:NAD(P)H-dependent oxidoreductase [Chlorobiota bacterium]
MNTLIINGHPSRESLIGAMGKAYAKGASQKGVDIKILEISDLNINLAMTGRDDESEEPEYVKSSQELIRWADHIVWFYPTWWADIPAKLKAFVEQVFTSGFAFKYKESKRYVKWDKYLNGKTAMLFSTMDGPAWYYKYFVGEPAFKMMRYNLKFCGFKKVGRKYYSSVVMSSEKQRLKWLNEIEVLGTKLK